MVLFAAGCAGPAEVKTRDPVEPVAEEPPESADYFVYHVRKNDTLFALGRRFQVPWREIAGDNDISSPDELRVGTPLVIREVRGVAVPQFHPEEPEQRPAARRRPVPRSELHRGHPASRFWWPTAGRVVRNHGDPFRSLPEPGIAIAAPAGTEVHAVADGRVISRVLAGDTPDSVWGHTVVIAHSGEMASSYAHLGQVLVEEGDRVEQGEAIGTVGTTGRTERPMLAFRLFSDQRLVDPVEHLP